MHLTNKQAKIYIAGHRGLVGSALVRVLQNTGYKNLILKTHQELDLCIEADVKNFFEVEKPEFVILAAAKVGGILANSTFPADFITDNLVIQNNVIQASHNYKVKRLIFLGSSCIYPKLAPQPLKEEYLLTAPLEPTNQWYAIAKIAGIKMCQAYQKQYGDDFISLMPTNLYGIGDNFDLKTSHVLPALIRKFHEAKVSGNNAPVVLWGTGSPKREFMHADDMAKACLFMLQQPEERIDAINPDRLFNVGVGKDLSILELARTIKHIVGATNAITHDFSKPDGTPQKLMDVSKINQLGWKATLTLEEGIRQVYAWYQQKVEE